MLAAGIRFLDKSSRDGSAGPLALSAGFPPPGVGDSKVGAMIRGPADRRGTSSTLEKTGKGLGMNQNSSTFPSAILMTLLGAAALGGVALAITVRKNGTGWRESLRALASRFNPQAGRLDSEDDESVQAVFI
jgi:hypothetical protein